MEKDYELTLTRNDISGRAIFALFGTLEDMQQSWVCIVDENKPGFVELTKEPVKVDVDYKNLERRFYAWHYSQTPTLILDCLESKTFIKIWHIAIDRIKHQTYNSGLDINAMIIYYNTILATLVDIHRERFEDDYDGEEDD